MKQLFPDPAFPLAALALALLASCQAMESPAVRYPGFQGYTRAITTESPAAQDWFDQGMQLLYGFNHDEAIRSFREAVAADPDCAMAWWGVAYANGLHINNTQMSEEQSRQGYEAAQRALTLLDDETPVERALVQAVAERYAWPAPEDRSALDQAYAGGMERAWRAFPDDPDAGALFAESLMDLQPWDLWNADGTPKGRTAEIAGILESVLSTVPLHPGANHFYIHTMEASREPEKALASAERLRTLVPGSGHLVHMPAHVYARVGRWGDVCDANVQAVAADRAYFALAPEPEFYSLYFVHNLHFLAYGAMMEGRFATAWQAAGELERDVPASFVEEWPQFADGFLTIGAHALIRFGKWQEVLALPEPPESRRISRAIRHYARSVAHSARGEIAEARAELAAFEAEAVAVPKDWFVGVNPAAPVLDIARHMLEGEFAYREGRHEEAFALLRRGVELEESLAYDEPPGWMQPVRHALGALLMGAGRAGEAETVYRADLARHPGNGWSLLGLENALRAQGRDEEAAGAAAERSRVWPRADVAPLSSCYCEPGARE